MSKEKTVTVVETTNILSEGGWRSYNLHHYKDFPNGAEGFNALSPIPLEPVMLDDVRQLHITNWKPVGNYEKAQTGILPITIEGFIAIPESYGLKEKE